MWRPLSGLGALGGSSGPAPSPVVVFKEMGMRGKVVMGAVVMAVLQPAAAVASLERELDACAALGEDGARLACYDGLRKRPGRAAAPTSESVAISPQLPRSAGAGSGAPASAMSSHWELDAESKKGLWAFRAHKPNYFLLGRYTSAVNRRPYDAYFNAVKDPDIGLDDTESKFQLSFKLKAMEDLFGTGADLWLAYTQQNHWQVYNKRISAPFRETNYEPELFATLPVHYRLLGLSGRFVSLGLVHQSNGESYVLSRSWNRVYAQFGFEYGDNFNLMLKPWYRLPEKAADDDNPRITDYVGDFEAVASYRMGRHTVSALGRSTFGLERGFLQLDLSYPLHARLKGYLQVTTGYGESLIDYQHRQNTIGLGVMLTDWM